MGSDACSGCHAREVQAWRGSHHAQAMARATPETVRGDFNDARLAHHGVVSRFFLRDGKYYVDTDGPDGRLADFEIRYTFGIAPLQQYLIPFPDGRLQALSIAWDARPAAAGGGRWYHLYPRERIDYRDPLHWTRLEQNWNWMCANCHTTHLERHYDAARNSYATTWSDMNVACEACHGPGSRHLAWAKHEPGSDHLASQGLIVALDERRGVSWLADATSGNAARSAALTTQRELDVCAQCHSRRTAYAEGLAHDGRFRDGHAIALLTPDLYFPDGQQRGEVYEVGSFLESRMHAHGVTCSDCHDPHSGKLRAAGNALCGQCHAPAKYDVPGHTLHAANTPGASCPACHMPARTYMGIDARRDHSIRIPRPDLSAALGTPDACTGCHADRSPAWAAHTIERAFGPVRKGFQSFSSAFHAATTGAPDAPAGLRGVVSDLQAPAIARATALALLRPYLSAAVLPTLEAGLADSDAMVRQAALDTLLVAPPPERVRLALRLTGDPNRIVRIKAARALAVIPDAALDAAERPRLAAAFAEYVASQRANADRPEAHVNLGSFYVERGDAVQAEAEYRAAIALDPDFVAGYVNLADLYRASARDGDAEAILTAGLRRMRQQADLTHALGLLRVRQGRAADALTLLRQAAQRAPDNPHYTYVYAVALYDGGRPHQALTLLERALERFPADRELLSALAAYAREAGDVRRAESYEQRLSGQGRR